MKQKKAHKAKPKEVIAAEVKDGKLFWKLRTAVRKFESRNNRRVDLNFRKAGG